MTTTPPASGAPDDTDIDGDSELAALRVGALTSQSDIDKYKNIYGSTLASNYVAEQTGWDGLTKEQEIQQERVWRDRAIAEAEYEEQMEEVRDRTDAMMAQVDEEERQCREKLDEINKKLDEIKKRPITLSDGRIVEPDANGQFTTDANGRPLSDADKANALGQQKQKEADEQATEADRRALNDQYARLDDEKAHLHKAQEASQSGNLSEAKSELALAQAAAPTQTHLETDAGASSTLGSSELALAQATAQKQAHVESTADASSTLDSTDMLAAIGLGGASDRTTSFSATLDQKDSRSTVMQNQFTGAAQGTPTPPPDDQAPVGNTVTKVQIVQPNQ